MIRTIIEINLIDHFPNTRHVQGKYRPRRQVAKLIRKENAL